MFKNFLFCLSVVTLVGCSSLEGTSHELLPKAQTKKPTINLSDKKKIAINRIMITFIPKTKWQI